MEGTQRGSAGCLTQKSPLDAREQFGVWGGLGEKERRAIFGLVGGGPHAGNPEPTGQSASYEHTHRRQQEHTVCAEWLRVGEGV
ncbi:hypothetical protein FBY35_4106 [Streptomyces sp. SLBN-118]|nr:hypothetical protein FBY35_4106 [Streptomyces sp. SLBN-118]